MKRKRLYPINLVELNLIALINQSLSYCLSLALNPLRLYIIIPTIITIYSKIRFKLVEKEEDIFPFQTKEEDEKGKDGPEIFERSEEDERRRRQKVIHKLQCSMLIS